MALAAGKRPNIPTHISNETRMSLAHEIEILRPIGPFRVVSDEALRILAIGGDRRRHDAGTIVFRDGDAAGGALVVLSGMVRIDIGGSRVMPVTAGPGSLIGEPNLIAAGRRMGVAVAIGAVELLEIRRDLFRRVAAEYPEVAEGLHAHLAGQLEMTRQALMGYQRQYN